MTAAAEFLAVQVAKTLGVPVADIRMLRWVDEEFASLQNLLQPSPDISQAKLSTLLKIRMHQRGSEFVGVLDFIPGISVQGPEFHAQLSEMEPPKRDHFWFQVGEIVAFDALINNVDRVPLLWDNEGNTANLMLRSDSADASVVGIDQAVTAIVAQGPGRARYAGRLRCLAEGVFKRPRESWEVEAAQAESAPQSGWSISAGMAHVSECFELSCGARVHWASFMDGLRSRLTFIADLVDNGSLATALDEATAKADQIFRAATVDVGYRQLPLMREFLMDMASVIAETRKHAADKDDAVARVQHA